jgi:hypothetical protein
MLNISSNSSELQHRLQAFKQLLYKHPFAFCGGLWVVLVFLAGLATLGLFNPGPREEGRSRPLPPHTTFEKVTAKPRSFKIWKPSTPEPTPVTTQKDSTPEQVPFTTVEVEESTPKQNLPLSLLGAIALGCAGGSLWLTQLLKYSAESYQDSRRLKPVGTIRKKRRNPPPKSRSVPKPPQPVSSKPNSKDVNKAIVTQDRSLAQITVLPPEQSHPLDGGKESLADMMDLRKRYSLSSLMRDK